MTVYNGAQVNRPTYPPENHHSSDVVYLRFLCSTVHFAFLRFYVCLLCSLYRITAAFYLFCPVRRHNMHVIVCVYSGFGLSTGC